MTDSGLPMGSSARSQLGPGCLAIFALPFLVVGIGAGVWTGHSVLRWRDARSWVVAQARLDSVHLETRHGDNSTTHEATAAFRYEYRGQVRTSTRVGLSGGSDNIGSWQQRVYEELKAKHSSGAPVPCYVNPRDPNEAVLNRDLRIEMVGFKLIFALVFTIAGAGLLVSAISARRRRRAQREAEVGHPESPWLWNSEWKSGRIPSSGKTGMVLYWFFAMFWNAISLPLLFLLPREVFGKGNHAAAIGFLFLLVGFGLLAWAIRATIQWRRFGSTVFQMAETPGVIGGRVAGAVLLPSGVRPPEGFRVTLSCVQRVMRRTSKGQHVSETPLWQSVRMTRPARLAGSAGQQAVPVLFAVPFELPETSRETERTQIIWRLQVEAKIPGVDYEASFDLPVFKTPASRADFALDEQAVAAFDATPDPMQTLRAARLDIRRNPQGGLVIVFPRAMRPGLAVGSTVFFAVWTAVCVFLWRADAPMIFPIVFTFMGLLVLFAVLDSWLGTARIEVARGVLTHSAGWSAGKPPRRIESSEIARIERHSGMQEGTKPSQQVFVVLTSGERVVLGRSMGDPLQTEALLSLLQSELGLAATPTVRTEYPGPAVG